MASSLKPSRSSTSPDNNKRGNSRGRWYLVTEIRMFPRDDVIYQTPAYFHRTLKKPLSLGTNYFSKLTPCGQLLPVKQNDGHFWMEWKTYQSSNALFHVETLHSDSLMSFSCCQSVTADDQSTAAGFVGSGSPPITDRTQEGSLLTASSELER